MIHEIHESRIYKTLVIFAYYKTFTWRRQGRGWRLTSNVRCSPEGRYLRPRPSTQANLTGLWGGGRDRGDSALGWRGKQSQQV